MVVSHLYKARTPRPRNAGFTRSQGPCTALQLEGRDPQAQSQHMQETFLDDLMCARIHVGPRANTGFSLKRHFSKYVFTPLGYSGCIRTALVPNTYNPFGKANFCVSAIQEIFLANYLCVGLVPGALQTKLYTEIAGTLYKSYRKAV